MQLRVVLERLIARLDRLELAEPVRHTSLVLDDHDVPFGIEHVHVTLVEKRT